MPGTFANSARLHAPLLPLYKSLQLNGEDVTPNLALSAQDYPTKQQTGRGPFGIISGKETSRRSARVHEFRYSKPEDNSAQWPTLIRSRFRVSLVRQHVYYQNHYIIPTTTISLSGKFCVESLPTCLPSPPCRRPLPARPSSIATLVDSQSFWLALYFFFNLSLTLYNKMVLVQFPFPYTLTALHALCGSIGGYLLVESGIFVPAKVNASEAIVLVVFSMLYAVNIIVSNVSLQLVTVPVSGLRYNSTERSSFLVSPSSPCGDTSVYYYLHCIYVGNTMQSRKNDVSHPRHHRCRPCVRPRKPAFSSNSSSLLELSETMISHSADFS
jgi:hypothetical protein